MEIVIPRNVNWSSFFAEAFFPFFGLSELAFREMTFIGAGLSFVLRDFCHEFDLDADSIDEW
jgi:hypothetical protein